MQVKLQPSTRSHDFSVSFSVRYFAFVFEDEDLDGFVVALRSVRTLHDLGAESTPFFRKYKHSC